MQYRVFSDFMKHNAPRILGFKPQHLIKMPCDSLSFAVFIGSEPHHTRLSGRLLQLAHKLGLILGDFIYGFEILFYINTETALLQVADMTETRHNPIIRPKKFFDCFGLGGRFDYYKITGCAHVLLCKYIYSGGALS